MGGDHMCDKNEAKKEYRTYQMDIKKGHKLYRYFDQICTNSNNLYNTTNFYIRQVYTALNQDKKWQPLQKEVMDHIQNNLQKMNDNQTKSYHKRLEKEKQNPIFLIFPQKKSPLSGITFLIVCLKQ